MTEFIDNKEFLIIEQGKYEGDASPFYYKFPYESDDFQKFAHNAISKNHNVLITAPTGCGKTNPIIYAIAKTISEGKIAIYTGPIKALINQKYGEFSEIFTNVGKLTGDKKDLIRTNSGLICMTAEILRNSLGRKNNESVYDYNFKPEDIGLVIMDEAHSINLKDRGQVWKDMIRELPNHIQLVLASATLNGGELLAEYIGRLKQKPCHLIIESKRPIPLTTYLFHKNELLKVKGKQWEEGIVTRVRSELKHIKLKNSMYRIFDFVKFADENNLFPLNVFLFSIDMIEEIGKKIPLTFIKKDENDITNISKITKIWNKKMINFEKEELKYSGQINKIKDLIFRGIGIHHSGIHPILREITEILYCEGLLPVIFTTETFAQGLNNPTKTACLIQLKKNDGRKKRPLTSEELNQIIGRAGRRIDGKKDTNEKFPGGIVAIIPNNLDDESIIKKMFSSNPKKISTTFDMDWRYVLKRLLYRTENELFDKPILEFLIEPIKRSLFYSEFMKELKMLDKKSKIDLSKYIHLDEYIDKYIDMKIKENRIKDFSNSYITISAKSRNKMNKDINKIKTSIPNEMLDELKTYYEDIKKIQESDKKINAKKNIITEQLEHLLQFLVEEELLEKDYSLTTLGYTIAGINDCNPLILGNLIKNRYFDDLEFSEIVALLSIFIIDKKLQELTFGDLDVSKDFKNNLKDIDRLCSNLNNKELQLNRKLLFNFHSKWNISLTMFNVVKSWAEGKRWNEVEKSYKKSYEGHFVRNILRLNSLITNVNNIAQITNDTILMNKLDGFQEKLIRDIVVNDSLYS